MATVKGNFTIHVAPAVQALALVPPSGALDDEIVGQAVTGGVSSVGGKPPVTFAVTQGTLPDGVTLDANTGQLSGVPTSAGDATIEISATDSEVVE